MPKDIYSFLLQLCAKTGSPLAAIIIHVDKRCNFEKRVDQVEVSNIEKIDRDIQEKNSQNMNKAQAEYMKNLSLLHNELKSNNLFKKFFENPNIEYDSPFGIKLNNTRFDYSNILIYLKKISECSNIDLDNISKILDPQTLTDMFYGYEDIMNLKENDVQDILNNKIEEIKEPGTRPTSIAEEEESVTKKTQGP